MKNNYCWVSYYPKADSHIRDKVKVVIDWSNYASKKELKHAKGNDRWNLAAKWYFSALKPEVETLNFNKMIKVPTGLNDLKTILDDLDAGKLKTVPKHSKELSDIVSKEVVKKTVYKTLKAKLNNLEKKRNLEKINGKVENKIRDINGLVTITTPNTKITKYQTLLS